MIYKYVYYIYKIFVIFNINIFIIVFKTMLRLCINILTMLIFCVLVPPEQLDSVSLADSSKDGGGFEKTAKLISAARNEAAASNCSSCCWLLFSRSRKTWRNLVNFRWCGKPFARGGATNLRGGAMSVGHVTNSLN